MKYYFYLIIFLILGNVYSQNFSAIVDEISNNLNQVTTKSAEISQTISEASPGVIELTRTTTIIKDGKSTVEVFVFNPADVDVNTVRATTNKDVIEVQILIRNKQKLIKKTVDHTKTLYIDALYIQGSDINNGRDIAELIKKAIPFSIEITDKRLSLTSYQDHLNWLTNEIGEVTAGEKQFSQSISASSDYPGRLSYNVLEATSKSSKKSLFEFNAMNINPNAILFKVSGDVFSLQVETKRKLNVVKQFVNDEQKNYTNSFEITCKSVEQARDIQKVLKEFVALSETEFDKSTPRISSVNQAFSIVNQFIEKSTVNDITYSQSIDIDCVTKFSKNEASSSKNVTEEFTFNFSDINKNAISYKANRQFLVVSISTIGGNNYIKHIQDNVQKNYTGSIDIAVSEIEEAIIIENALKYIVEQCEKNVLSYKGKSKQELQNILFSEIVDITAVNKTLNQTLSQGNSEGALSFKLTEITDKASKEKLYEFNYSDINAASIKTGTSRQSVFVTFNTNYNEKIIQYYEDGAIKNYQNSIQIEAVDVENARRIAEALKVLVGK